MLAFLIGIILSVLGVYLYTMYGNNPFWWNFSAVIAALGFLLIVLSIIVLLMTSFNINLLIEKLFMW